jgi:hypothetical protein
MRATLFSYMWRHGDQCHGADGRPGESCSSRGVVARPVLVQEQLRGWRHSGWSSGHRRGPIQGCRQRGPVRGTVAVVERLVPVHSNSIGMSSQCPAWCDSGGDGRTGLTATGKTAPVGLTSRRGPTQSQKRYSRVSPAPLRGLDALAVRGMASPRESVEQRRDAIPGRVRVVAHVLRCQGIKCSYGGRSADDVRAGALERDDPRRGGVEPSGKADPARGSAEASSEADSNRGGAQPSSEADSTRGCA